MTKKYTPEGLPVVTQDVIDVIMRDNMRGNEEMTRFYSESGVLDKQHTLPNLIDNNMKDNNRQLYEFIRGVAEIEKNISESVVKSYVSGAFIVYELLRRQVESNRLEDTLTLAEES